MMPVLRCLWPGLIAATGGREAVSQHFQKRRDRLETGVRESASRS
jgi:hypothetical protein